MRNTNTKGFTLVELVVVIAIIGVLATILVPSLMGYVRKSRMRTANSNAKTAYDVVAGINADCEMLGHPIIWNGIAVANIDCTQSHSYAALDATASNYAAVITYEVSSALQTNGNEAGMVTVGSANINNTNTFFCHWKKTGVDDMYGQYPQAIKNVDTCTTNPFGSWINV